MFFHYLEHPIFHKGAAARDGFLDRDDDDVTHGCVFTLGTTQDLDALNFSGARIVSNIQIGLHLDHLVSPDLWGACFCLIPRVSLKLKGAGAYASSTSQRFVLDLGAHSMMRTVSPTL